MAGRRDLRDRRRDRDADQARLGREFPHRGSGHDAGGDGHRDRDRSGTGGGEVTRDRRIARHRPPEPPRQRCNTESRDEPRLHQPEHEIFMKSRTLRSLLAVPATSPRFLEKAAQGPADAIFIDLEDAVINVLKPKARADAIAAINGLDWGERIVAVRVNSLGTSWGCRDILDVVEACPRLDYILLPKCESPGDVHAVEVIMRSAEAAASRDRKVGIMGLIETPRGVANVEAIAQAGGGLFALVFGGGDYQLDLGSFQ